MINFKHKYLWISLVVLFITILLFIILSYTGRNKVSNYREELKHDKSSISEFNKSMNIKGLILKMFDNWNNIFDIFTLNLKKYNEISYETEEDIRDSLGLKRRFRPVFKSNNTNVIISEYGDFIKERSRYYNIDWRLILAIIHQESFFDSTAVSRAGAFGLMQIMPRTGMGLQSQLNLEDTRSARNNLIAGIHYYATLVSAFEPFGEDKYKFALVSYNAGLSRMVDLMTIAAHYGKDYKKWEEVIDYFTYLSSRYDSVHKQIWQNGKPSGGTLNNWKEPYCYVEYVSYFFEEYKKILEGNLREEKKVQKNKNKIR